MPASERLPGDTDGYSAWVERLEPIAAQRVGWMNERITQLTDALIALTQEHDAERARAERLEAALRNLMDVIADAVSVGEMQGEDFSLMPWATLQAADGRYLDLLAAEPQPPAPAEQPAVDPPHIRRGIGDLNGCRQRYVTCSDCGWLTYTDSPNIVDHTDDCPHNSRRRTAPSASPSGEP